MRGRKSADTLDIDEVRTRFENWRQNRQRKARIRDELWAAEIEVAHRNGVNRTAAELHLDGGKLKRRMVAAGTVSGSAMPPAFMEMVVPQTVGLPECTIELEGRKGKLRIHWKGASGRELRQKLMEAARRREIDIVLVWRLDRWGRSLPDLVSTLEELNHLRGGFVSLTEAVDLTPTGRAMAGLLKRQFLGLPRLPNVQPNATKGLVCGFALQSASPVWVPPHDVEDQAVTIYDLASSSDGQRLAYRRGGTQAEAVWNIFLKRPERPRIERSSTEVTQ